MSSYKNAVEPLLVREGGFVNNPADRGGPTNWGITQAVYEKFKGRKVTLDEMKKMPKADAVAIYKPEYWDKIHGDKIKFFAVANTMFDQAVNRGVNATIKQAQRVAGVSQDGIIGPKTLTAINASMEHDFITKFLAESVKSYNAIVASNPSQSQFIKNWLGRVEKLRVEAVKWAGTLTTTTVSVALIATLGLGLGAFLFLRSRRK